MLNLYEHSKKLSIRPTAVILLYVFVKTPKETFRPIACVDFVSHLYIKATRRVTWSGHCDTCVNLVLHSCIDISTLKKTFRPISLVVLVLTLYEQKKRHFVRSPSCIIVVLNLC